MKLKDWFRRIFAKKTSPNESGSQSNAAKLSDARQSQAAETPLSPKAEIEDMPTIDAQQDQKIETAKFRIEDTPIRKLWNVAYEKLREEDSALIAEYEESLPHNVATGLKQTLHLKSNMRDQLQKEIEEVKEKASTLSKGGPAIEIVLGIVESANDYISKAASANPYTSIAWTGVSLLLPLLMNPSSQNASLAKAIDDVASLISQSIMREEFYQECDKAGTSSYETSHGQYKIALESLYRQILKFEVIGCCHYYKNSAVRFGLDVVKWNNWEQLAAEVKDKNTKFLAADQILRYTPSSAMDIALKNANSSKEAEGYTKLLHWLCEIDPSSMFNAARDNHAAGTCTWLVQDNYDFKDWEEGRNSLLWLHGKAGSGISILSSSVIKHLQDCHAENASIALAYFYFSFSDPKKQNVDGMLASLIRQICSRQLNKQIFRRLDEYMVKGQRPDAKTLGEILISSLSGFSDVYIVLDALDECPALNERRKRLLESLNYILANAPDGLHIFLTSRKESDIDDEMRAHLSEPFKMEIDLLAYRGTLNRDICHYIDSKLAAGKFKSWPENVKMEARNSLLDKADCMFQYIQCQFEILQRLSSANEIHEALQKLPEGLDATYDRIFESIDPIFIERVVHSVKWLAFSMRTLTLEELSEIFIIRQNSSLAINKKDRLFSPVHTLEYFSGLIITQTRDAEFFGYPDYNTDTKDSEDSESTEVRLVHFSLKEYFISTRIAENSSAFAFSEIEAHISIGCSCLAYLTQFSTEIAKRDRDNLSGLAEYVITYWMVHVEEVPRGRWPDTWAKDIALVIGFHSQSFFNQLRLGHELDDMIIHEHLRLPSYCYTARLGLYRLTQMLFSHESNAYTTQEDLDVALQYAALSGNIEVMELFLKNEKAGADVNAKCNKWGSALLAAAAEGNLSALELLVKSGADVDGQSEEGRSPLGMAVGGSTQCLRFLLDSRANIDIQDSDGETALSRTLEGRLRHRDRDQFELLLERNANVNALGGKFYTPLQKACAYVEIDEVQYYVESLLKRGADPNIRGGEYGTALQAVCARFDLRRRDISVIQLLIKYGADVNLRGGRYGSAFNAAAGHESSSAAIQIMKLLLDNGAEIDQRGTSDWDTALHIACNKGSIETVRWLLDMGVDVNAESGRFATPLQAAVAGEPWSRDAGVLLNIVKLLVEKGAEMNRQGGEYGTVLQAAYANRLGGLSCRWLLEHGVDINIKGGKYGTVLAAACGNSGMDVEDVRLLLDHGADINTEGGEYGTALAAVCGRRASPDLVSLLLERGADPHRQNCLAWHMAARAWEGKHAVSVFKLLLEHIDIDHVHAEHGTALTAVLERWDLGHIWDRLSRTSYEKVRFLLESGADADIMAGKFGFALQAACVAEYEPEYGDPYEDDIDHACVKTKILLEQRPDINVNAQGGIFNTALQAAAYSGQTTSIRLLLEKKADCNIRGGKYGSALNAAIISGRWDIVEILLKAGATPDCRLQEEPDEEWLQRVREEDGRGAYERYMKFWEVQSASGGISK